MKTRITVLLGVLLLLSAAVAYAQPIEVKAPIDFAFTVEGKLLPAGQYDFKRTDDGTAFRVQSVGKEAKEGVLAMIITRLAGEMRDLKKGAYLVFDNAGDTTMLSEIWFPGEDGYLVGVMKGKHTHKMVHMK
jgi:hypothetical protein